MLEVRSQMEEIILLMHSGHGSLHGLVRRDLQPGSSGSIRRTPCPPIATRLSAVLRSVMAERGDAELLPRVFKAFGDELDGQLNMCG